MCNKSIGYCDGSCNEAKEHFAEEERLSESLKVCPHRKECIWITLDVKTDRCTTCGLITKY